MQDQNKLIAIFENHAEAEDAVRLLQSRGFDMKNMTLIGQDYHTEEHPLGYVNTGNRVKYWGKFGALWGGLCGILFGSALLVVPGVGQLVVLGALTSALVNAVGGAVIGGAVGAAGGALASIGIPKNAVIQYETALKAGKFMLMAHGSEEKIHEAKITLESTPTLSLDHHAPQAAIA